MRNYNWGPRESKPLNQSNKKLKFIIERSYFIFFLSSLWGNMKQSVVRRKYSLLCTWCSMRRWHHGSRIFCNDCIGGSSNMISPVVPSRWASGFGSFGEGLQIRCVLCSASPVMLVVFVKDLMRCHYSGSGLLLIDHFYWFLQDVFWDYARLWEALFFSSLLRFSWEYSRFCRYCGLWFFHFHIMRYENGTSWMSWTRLFCRQGLSFLRMSGQFAWRWLL